MDEKLIEYYTHKEMNQKSNDRKRIIELSQNDHYLNHAIRMWQSGFMTFEQAMIEVVICYSRQVKQYEEVIQTYRVHEIHPKYIFKGDIDDYSC